MGKSKVAHHLAALRPFAFFPVGVAHLWMCVGTRQLLGRHRTWPLPLRFLFLEPPGFPTWAAVGSQLTPLSPASFVWDSCTGLSLGYKNSCHSYDLLRLRWPEPPSGTADYRDHNPPLTKHLLCARHLPCLALSGLLQHMGALANLRKPPALNTL